MKHLLKLGDLTQQEITDLLNLADQLKFERKNSISNPRLKGKTLGMIFSKSSTRTRVSFEVGMYELGGYPLFLSEHDIQLGRGESVRDTARVLSRYLDGIMIRTYKQEDVEDLARYGSIPVINGLTDFCHPCQVLADLLTVREYKGVLAGLKLAYIGDGNNMANSLIAGGITMGMTVAVACPDGYMPDARITAKAAKTGRFIATNDIYEAVREADVLYTDVWASMGQEAEAEARRKVFDGYQINAKLLESAKPDCMVLHCLPAHRGEEITDEVFEAHASELFDEAENRLHAQKAVLVRCLGGDI